MAKKKINTKMAVVLICGLVVFIGNMVFAILNARKAAKLVDQRIRRMSRITGNELARRMDEFYAREQEVKRSMTDTLQQAGLLKNEEVPETSEEEGIEAFKEEIESLIKDTVNEREEEFQSELEQLRQSWK